MIGGLGLRRPRVSISKSHATMHSVGLPHASLRCLPYDGRARTSGRSCVDFLAPTQGLSQPADSGCEKNATSLNGKKKRCLLFTTNGMPERRPASSLSGTRGKVHRAPPAARPRAPPGSSATPATACRACVKHFDHSGGTSRRYPRDEPRRANRIPPTGP